MDIEQLQARVAELESKAKENTLLIDTLNKDKTTLTSELESNLGFKEKYENMEEKVNQEKKRVFDLSKNSLLTKYEIPEMMKETLGITDGMAMEEMEQLIASKKESLDAYVQSVSTSKVTTSIQAKPRTTVSTDDIGSFLDEYL